VQASHPVHSRILPGDRIPVFVARRFHIPGALRPEEYNDNRHVVAETDNKTDIQYHRIQQNRYPVSPDSTKQISSITGFNRKRIRSLLNKIGRIDIPKYYASMPKLGGNNAIVEIDESKFGKGKHNRGHHVEGVWILGMVDRSTRKIHLVAVDKRDAPTLEARIERNVADDSIIYTVITAPVL